MIELTTSTLAYPAESRAAWRDGPEMLEAARVDEDLKNILSTKRKARPGSRFFGEAFVATKLRHKQAFYGSFQWLTTSRFLADDPFPRSPTAPFKEKYRRALHYYFGTQLTKLQENAKRLRDRTGVKPAAPDLWLVVQRNRHRFIEVKLPRDHVRDSQLAGLAVIAVSLAGANREISVEVINLYPEGQTRPRTWRSQIGSTTSGGRSPAGKGLPLGRPPGWIHSVIPGMDRISPMRLLRIPEPFDSDQWFFEPKMDGFRALAHAKVTPAASSLATATPSNPGQSSRRGSPIR